MTIGMNPEYILGIPSGNHYSPVIAINSTFQGICYHSGISVFCAYSS